jgi:hypothetical protein
VAQTPTFNVDWLLVVDDSPAMGPHQSAVSLGLTRAMTTLENAIETHESPLWLHVGITTADPADGSILRSGCGLSAARPFIDLDGIDGENNLPIGTTLPQLFACLLPPATGAAMQAPLAAAWREVGTPLEANADFLRPDAALLITWITAADYGEDPQPYIEHFVQPRASGGVKVDPNDVILESVSNGSVAIHAVLAALKSSNPENVIELPLDSGDYSALLPPFFPVFGDSHPACLAAPPLDPARPECVVEDITLETDGSAQVTEVASCMESSWQPPCWELLADPRCPMGRPTAHVRRPPEGTPRNTTTRFSCACALQPG